MVRPSFIQTIQTDVAFDFLIINNNTMNIPVPKSYSFPGNISGVDSLQGNPLVEVYEQLR